MAIELDINNSQPSVNRNRVFLTRLEILQKKQLDDNAKALYNVTIEWECYGVDANHKRHYCVQHDEVNFPDFLDHAMQQAAEGDMRHIQALQAIEGAVAAIIADQLNTTASII